MRKKECDKEIVQSTTINHYYQRLSILVTPLWRPRPNMKPHLTLASTWTKETEIHEGWNIIVIFSPCYVLPLLNAQSYFEQGSALLKTKATTRDLIACVYQWIWSGEVLTLPFWHSANKQKAQSDAINCWISEKSLTNPRRIWSEYFQQLL